MEEKSLTPSQAKTLIGQASEVRVRTPFVNGTSPLSVKLSKKEALERLKEVDVETMMIRVHKENPSSIFPDVIEFDASIESEEENYDDVDGDSFQGSYGGSFFEEE